MAEEDEYIGELEVIAERMRALVNEGQAAQFKGNVTAIEDVIDAVHKSWSGSNIGYHARVYYKDYRPPPNDVMFNKQWGLMLRGRDDRGWVIHADDDEVKADIMSRAGADGFESLKAKSDEARTTLAAAKEAMLSILSNYLSLHDDSYLTELREKVTNVSPKSAIAYARQYLPRGSQRSKDSRAINQGLAVAPHQQILAQLNAIVAPYVLADSLADYATNAAEHIRRKPSEPPVSIAPQLGSRVFIGHGGSPQWRELKDYIQDQLGLPVDEFNRVPAAGFSTIARLNEMLDSAAMAFLVMTAEDEMADGTRVARDNVIHEVGLFQGRLGFEKAIVMLEEGCEEFSNIHGLIQVRYPKGNISAKFHEVHALLQREGLV